MSEEDIEAKVLAESKKVAFTIDLTDWSLCRLDWVEARRIIVPS